MKGYYTIRELWNGEWWTWYMLDGKPCAFVKDGVPTTEELEAEIETLKTKVEELTYEIIEANERD